MIFSKEYTYESLHGITYGSRALKLYRDNNFDLARYQHLKKESEQIYSEIDTFKRFYSLEANKKEM